MHSYAAFLGNNPALSSAELSALLPDFTPEKTFQNSVITFQTAKELDQDFLNRLGGTLILARKLVGDATLTLEDIGTVLTTELAPVKGKATFSFRTVGISPKNLANLYRSSKKHLKSKGIGSRYIGSEREAAKAIQLHDEGALDPKRGAEIVILQSEHHLWIGRTVAAQDVKAYTLRDIEKPVRDTTVGLLPPKLAQILLNFGEYLVTQNSKFQASNSKNEQTSKRANEKLTIFDPFTGTGVIPLEAMLRGEHVLASDISEKAVTGTKKNIEWVRKTYKILKSDIEATVWKQDARKPFELKEKPDVIVTEGSLGPALKSRPGVGDSGDFKKNAEALVAAFLRNAAATLPGTPIVLTIPVWYAKQKMIFLEKIWAVIEELKYKPTLPPHTDPSHDSRFSLLYRRPEQFVGREILLLQAK